MLAVSAAAPTGPGGRPDGAAAPLACPGAARGGPGLVRSKRFSRAPLCLLLPLHPVLLGTNDHTRTTHAHPSDDFGTCPSVVFHLKNETGEEYMKVLHAKDKEKAEFFLTTLVLKMESMNLIDKSKMEHNF